MKKCKDKRRNICSDKFRTVYENRYKDVCQEVKKKVCPKVRAEAQDVKTCIDINLLKLFLPGLEG